MPPLPPNKPFYSFLDFSGVAGWTGGDDAVSAMTAVHVYGNRRWLGWYNNPGSFQIAKRLNSFAKSPSFHNTSMGNSPMHLSKSVLMDPLALFKSDACKGPKFRAASSGTVIEETGYLGALFMSECIAYDPERKVVPGRWTQPVRITIADLGQGPTSEMHVASSSSFTPLFASVPIAVSIGTCGLSAVCQDWYASMSILVGILASGVSCIVLGSADLVFTHPEPSNGSRVGDGILGSDTDTVLLTGTEGAINSVTHGGFFLRFSSEDHFNLVRSCSILYFIQCIAQLFLIPHASLFGHAMFFTSLGVSALYNAWRSPSCKDKFHQKLLLESVLKDLKLTKYTLGTRAAAAVFILLVLQPQDPTGLLDELVPNDTSLWRQWKVTILRQVLDRSSQSLLFESRVGALDGFGRQQQDLLRTLYDDARAAYDAYRDYLQIDLL